jgi:hypothetical protein
MDQPNQLGSSVSSRVVRVVRRCTRDDGQRGVSRKEDEMPRYVYTDEDGNRFEVESEEELEMDQEPEDQPDDGDDEEEVDDNEETAAHFAFVEDFFKTERAAIRRITDVTELRTKRQAYEAALQTPNPSRIGLVRVRDLLALVEERELDLRAQRLAGRSR